ncbi:MAG: hypothetical protein PVI30_24925 [Myxococcales bacterium]
MDGHRLSSWHHAALLLSHIALFVGGCGAGDAMATGRRAASPPMATDDGAAGAGALASASTAGDFGNSTTMQPELTPEPRVKGASAPVCTPPELDDFTVPECELSAPPDSFDPVVQWDWEGGNGMGPPLVANLSDDNGDGRIDLCDTPDVVVPAGGFFSLFPLEIRPSVIHVLDGATGEQHCETSVGVGIATPAIGDIDGDGLPEIVAQKALQDGFVGNGGGWGGLIVFDHQCNMKWQADLQLGNFVDQLGTFSIGLIDAEGDGDVEIMMGTALFDHEGRLLWNRQDEALFTGLSLASVAADLDDDGDLEIVTGTRAYHHDGTIAWDQPAVLDFFNIADRIGLYPLVANLDDDPEPEVLVSGGQGLFILEHDGTIETRFSSGAHGWLDLGDFAPPTVHDFDGDGEPEIALGARNGFTIFERDLTPMWTSEETDGVLSGATAFDFLGDGVAEAIYSDKDELLIFDGQSGEVVMRVPRTGALDYPVVADVDNDGSAEILIVSGPSEFFSEKVAPTLQVIGDAQERWIPTRRIWNQLNYSVTNVREDATIPPPGPGSWQAQNTFRTNVQLEAGGVCVPPTPAPL